MLETFSVKNKVALITGASSGIGKHFAITLAKAGAHIICVGRNEKRLKETEAACQAFGVKTLAHVADVSHAESIENLKSECKKHFSEIHTIINAAGIAMRVPTLELSEKQWDDVMNINLKGTFMISQSFAKWMIETKTSGSIINISSSAAFHISLTRTAYSTSKIAVESLTRSLALSLVSHGIRVNCIAPGFFVTDLTRDYIQSDLGRSEVAAVPMQRAADVSELEGTLLLLSSNASSYITGSILHVDGGYAISKT